MNKILSPVACCVVALLLGGCINISSRITRENQAVKPMTEGSDCSYAIMNFGYGTNTVEQAMANAIPPVQKVTTGLPLNESALAFSEKSRERSSPRCVAPRKVPTSIS